MNFVKLRNRKKQYFLLGLIFTIVIVLFSACTIFCAKAKTFVDEYYKGDATPDIVYTTMSKEAANKSVEWTKLQGDVVWNVHERDVFSVSNNIRANDKLLDTIATYIIPIKDINEVQWKVKVTNGDKESLVPKQGEIWILKSFADKKGFIPGDKIKIKDSKGKDIEFKISALINDSNQTSMTQSIFYFYINDYDKDKLKDVTKAYFITFNTKEDYKIVINDIKGYINMPIGGFLFDKGMSISQAAQIPLQIGGVGMVSGILLVIMLIIILRANLWNFILKEYKSIGIYKSIGMSSKQIGRLYLTCYGTIALISSVFGLLISIPIAIYMCNTIFQYIGEYKFDIDSLIIIVSIFIGFNLLVYLNLKLILIRIKKIKPVEAINIGLTSSKEKFKKSLIKDNSSALAMAINDVFKYKKSSFITLLIFALSFYISIFFINTQNSMFRMDENFSEWFGHAKGDMVISSSSDNGDTLKEVIKYIDENKYAKTEYLWNMKESVINIKVDDKKYKGNIIPFNIVSYNQYNEQDFSINKGKNPREKNDIAVSENYMKKNNFKIGDYMELIVKGERKEYLITGTYNIMSDSGLRILTSSLDAKGGNVAYINLNNKDDFENIKKDLEDKFDYITVDKTLPAAQDAVVAIKSLSLKITSIILGGIIAFSMITVVNTVMSINADNRKNYGIMKAQGFSSSYIRSRCLYRIMILSFTGAIIGLGINLISSRAILKAMLDGVNGYVFSLTGTGLGILGLMLVTVISTILSCRAIKKVSTTELIMD